MSRVAGDRTASRRWTVAKRSYCLGPDRRTAEVSRDAVAQLMKHSEGEDRVGFAARGQVDGRLEVLDLHPWLEGAPRRLHPAIVGWVATYIRVATPLAMLFHQRGITWVGASTGWSSSPRVAWGCTGLLLRS